MNVPPRLPTEGAAATYAPPIIASNWRPIGKGTLVGTADLYIVKWRTDFFGAMWHRKDSREWINFPSREYIDKETGERKFYPLCKFKNHGDARRFSEAAIEAIKLIAGERP
jgi:hypothetical protein